MDFIIKECVVIGAGISGIALARWLKVRLEQYEIDFVLFEKSDDVAGLWRYKPNDYGVMSFTHINVSKYNYCFSDFPFPEDSVEFMHHTHIYEYVKAYIAKHDLKKYFSFKSEVILVEELTESSDLFETVKNNLQNKKYDKLWKTTVKDLNTNEIKFYISFNISIATGHHGTPRIAEFPGQDSFLGEIIHSVKYKNILTNNMKEKRMLLVGIGNSSVDIADELVTKGKCKVTISTRSGTWITPNYISGFPVDLHLNRFSIYSPWKLQNFIYENLVKFIFGHPKKYNLNPTVSMLQTHPTVSATIVHHIQRKNVQIKPNIKKISGSEVTFENEDKENFDAIILCTGYKIDLSILHPNLKKQIFQDEESGILNLFKLVFHPKIGSTLSFIGMVQPHSGGILSMSEIQARWIVYLIKHKIKLPPEDEMFKQIQFTREKFAKRFKVSPRHTIQEDPIIYNDEISNFYGAKPSYLKNLGLAWRLLFSSCGTAQWRLNGIDASEDAKKMVMSVPVPGIFKIVTIVFILLGFLLLWTIFHFPLLLPILFILYLFTYIN